MWGVLAGVIGAQLLAIFFLKEEVGDVFLFSKAGYYLHHHSDFYLIDQYHEQYPFFPFLIFLYAQLNALLASVPWATFSMLLKLILLIPLHLLGFLIQERQETVPAVARQRRLQFLLHPITYSVVLFHGQTDVVLIGFFVLSSWLFLERTGWQRWLLSPLAFAASVASKTWSVIFFPILIRYQRSMWYSLWFVGLAAGALFANIYYYTTFAVYNSSFERVFAAVGAPGGPIGVWGLSILAAPLLPLVLPFKLFAFALLLGLIQLLILTRKATYMQSIFLVILGVYLIILNWGIQYLFWLLPFAYLLRDWFSPWIWRTYMVLASGYLLLNYLGVATGALVVPAAFQYGLGLALWGLFLVWFVVQWRLLPGMKWNEIWAEVRALFKLPKLS